MANDTNLYAFNKREIKVGMEPCPVTITTLYAFVGHFLDHFTGEPDITAENIFAVIAGFLNIISNYFNRFVVLPFGAVFVSADSTDIHGLILIKVIQDTSEGIHQGKIILTVFKENELDKVFTVNKGILPREHIPAGFKVFPFRVISNEQARFIFSCSH